MKIRKFQIIDVQLSPGGAGPEQAWRVKYRAIVDKRWVEQTLFVLAKNQSDARAQAEKRFGDKI